MKKLLLLFTLCICSFVSAQAKNTKPYYFYSLMYGQNNLVYVTNVYELHLESKDLYGKLVDRYKSFQNYLVSSGKISNVKELQTGLEKHYFTNLQAQNELKLIISDLEKKKFVPVLVEYNN